MKISADNQKSAAKYCGTHQQNAQYQKIITTGRAGGLYRPP